MRVIKGNSFAETYKELLDEISNNNEYEAQPRGKKIKETLNVSLVINNPLSNLFTSPVREFPKKYLAGELLWYFGCRNDVEFISKYSKFWTFITNPDGLTVNSAYGHLVYNVKNEYGESSWEYARKALLNDKDSRQSIIRFNRSIHEFEGNKDFVCTLFGTFHIRDNKLHFSVTMRSQDIVRGTTFDVPYFVLLQQAMLQDLKEAYPDLELGTYTHTMQSCHVYEEHFDLINQMLDNEILEDKLPALTCNPFMSKEINDLINDTYSGDDEFFNWIKENK